MWQLHSSSLKMGRQQHGLSWPPSPSACPPVRESELFLCPDCSPAMKNVFIYCFKPIGCFVLVKQSLGYLITIKFNSNVYT